MCRHQVGCAEAIYDSFVRRSVRWFGSAAVAVTLFVFVAPGAGWPAGSTPKPAATRPATVTVTAVAQPEVVPAPASDVDMTTWRVASAFRDGVEVAVPADGFVSFTHSVDHGTQLVWFDGCAFGRAAYTRTSSGLAVTGAVAGMRPATCGAVQPLESLMSDLFSGSSSYDAFARVLGRAASRSRSVPARR